jgi:hypothetical protein
MPRAALLQLQRALVDELGRESHLLRSCATLVPALQGLDVDRVALLARMTHAKRLGKIARVLPLTIAALAPDLQGLFPQFVARHPMRSANGVANALQFCRFVRRRVRQGKLRPAHAADLAACELAIAAVALRNPVGARMPAPSAERSPLAYRRARGAALRVCRYDVQALLQSGSAASTPVARRTLHLAFVPGFGDALPRIYEIDPAAFALLRGMGDWQRVVLEPGNARNAAQELLEQLTLAGILECRTDCVSECAPAA